VSLSPGPLGAQAVVPSERGAAAAGGFFFSLMPKRNRMGLKRLTNTPYRSKIRGKETTAMIRYLGNHQIV
jgi:hypothetical protein